jgi:hypothetical protein
MVAVGWNGNRDVVLPIAIVLFEGIAQIIVGHVSHSVPLHS